MKSILKKSKYGDRRRGGALFKSARIVCVFSLSLMLSACFGNMDENPDKLGATANTAPVKPSPATEGEKIIERYRALDNCSDSTAKITANIKEATGETKEVRLNIYRKREADGSLRMLIEFTAPDQERDRAALITIGPEGEIKATRYAQSNDTFVTTTDVAGEDSLFGMTLQELADGQSDRYNFSLEGEETVDASPAYRVEGTLKEGAESKFPRIVMLISKENSTAFAAEFYNRQNELIRRATIDEVKQIGSHWTRMHWIIENRARKKTIDFKTTSMHYDQNLSDSLFTREHLKKLASR